MTEGECPVIYEPEGLNHSCEVVQVIPIGKKKQSGVAQRSIIGPVLFIIFLFDLIKLGHNDDNIVNL